MRVSVCRKRGGGGVGCPRNILFRWARGDTLRGLRKFSFGDQAVSNEKFPSVLSKFRKRFVSETNGDLVTRATCGSSGSVSVLVVMSRYCNYCAIFPDMILETEAC